MRLSSLSRGVLCAVVFFARVPNVNSAVPSFLTATPASERTFPAGDTRLARGTATGDVSGTITDSTSGQPLVSAQVSVMQNGRIIANTLTGSFGVYRVHNLSPGAYDVSARFLGFAAKTRRVTVGTSATDITGNDFALVPTAVNLSAIAVTAVAPIAVDTRTGDQVFSENQSHIAPTTTTSQILQQSIAGAVRAPTGEVHIRGQHAEYTYYVDGVPVPSGISGSLNELFDPQVVNQITFQTGAWDAEYGNKNAAIVNVVTRIPSGGFHTDLGTYAGQYDQSGVFGPKTFNGQSLSLSTNKDRWGFFLSGARQFTDMRLEPIVFDSTASKIVNFHNDGQDLFGFGKIQYAAGSRDVVNLDLSDSRTHFSVPYDSSGGTTVDDHQTDVNGFANLGWHHQFAASGKAEAPPPGELFMSAFYRHGSLNYLPGASDDPQFIFFPDTTPYNLTESRDFNTYGVKLDYNFHTSSDVEFKFGTTSSATRGHEDFHTVSATGAAGPASISDLKGSDIGVYGQTSISPVEWFEVRAGVRYDAHNAPFARTKSQVSPRIRLNLRPSPATTLYLYYGRLFLPTNVEDLRAVTSSALGNDVTPNPTLPERDNFYEAGLIQHFPAGLTFKLSGYRKESTPGIDDNTVPGSAIVTSVNIDKVWINGIEGVLEVKPAGPLSGYANVALNHAYGRGPITGGFFPEDTPQGFFDLDHDQRLSVVGSATYSLARFYATGTGIYGSGLTNGASPEDCGCDYGTGLFSFNKGIHVPGQTVFNGSAGYTLTVGASALKLELYGENLANKKYALKGAFFSGPAIGRPRSVGLRVNFGF